MNIIEKISVIIIGLLIMGLGVWFYIKVLIAIFKGITNLIAKLLNMNLNIIDLNIKEINPANKFNKHLEQEKQTHIEKNVPFEISNNFNRNISTRKIKEINSYNLSDRQLDAYNKKGDNQIKRIRQAIHNSKEIDDYTEAISVYENIIFEEGMCFVGDTHIMRLAELYYKNEQYDEAWNYLNQIQFYYPDLTKKIRYLQVKILKKENKNIDALATLMCANIYDYTNQKTETLNIEKFKNESKILLKKLNLDKNTTYFEYFVYLINCQLKSRTSLSSKEINLRKSLKDFLNDIKPSD